MPVLIGCLALPVLAVIIIMIGIVAAIAIPALSTARIQAGDRAAIAELSSVQVALVSYYVEHGVHTRSLAELDYTDDPEVATTILWADASGYALCSRHPQSFDAWRLYSGEGATVERAAGEC